MSVRRAVGDYGERVAARHLEATGWEVVARQWRCKLGELDLVAWDGDCVVAVEVKTRRSTAFGHPLLAITPDKARRLRRLLMAWLDAHDICASGVRVDAVAVTALPGEQPVVQHVRGVA